MDLAKILADHLAWLEDPAHGARANLSMADLREANLREANLRGADLSRAYLREANLRGADLSRADLSMADLSRANLSRAEGFRLLTQTDHGYFVFASLCGEEWRILAGCRDFSIAEARAHWGAEDYHTPGSGRRILACLDWLEREIARE